MKALFAGLLAVLVYFPLSVAAQEAIGNAQGCAMATGGPVSSDETVFVRGSHLQLYGDACVVTAFTATGNGEHSLGARCPVFGDVSLRFAPQAGGSPVMLSGNRPNMREFLFLCQ